MTEQMPEQTIAEEVQCAICLDLVTQQQVAETQVVYCSTYHHPFHTWCASHVTGNRCPTCREPLDGNLPVGPTVWDADNYPTLGDQVDNQPMPDHGAQFQGGYVLPSGGNDIGAAVVQGANLEISGGLSGYVDVTAGNVNTAQEGVAYDIYLDNGILAVQGAMVYGDYGDGNYVFSYAEGQRLI